MLLASLLADAVVPFTAVAGLELDSSNPPAADALVLATNNSVAPIFLGTNEDRAVVRAAADLAEDFGRVAGLTPSLQNDFSGGWTNWIIVGTLGRSGIVDQLAADKKIDVTGVSGQWESYLLQVVRNPLPGVGRALVIAGSDRRGTIYGLYQLSEIIGVSPWYWWADVPVERHSSLALRGDGLKQGPPAVKYRGIFLNDEDWGLRPWASRTFDPQTGNIGPKTYAKIFELLLRLRANYLWPAMHPGTAAFNSFPQDRGLANGYGIVMGSSHCEQMLRNNISEWDEKVFGAYNFVTNSDGVLKYWEQRVRENGRFENTYTLGMRGIHDSGMPGGGSEREKAARLQTIIGDQREMLARLVNPNVAQVPQIFCPYKEVLGLYRLMTNLPEDITLVWPDDNYGFIRQYSSASERQRAGGAGVYYHFSYYGNPRDYLWLCSTPPGLAAEEMTKAFDYGANRVWIVNVGDLKPAELDIEFFLKLAWDPHSWNGTNTYTLFEKQLARDFGDETAPDLTSIMARYYRLNFQRKPEHICFPTNRLFTASEAAHRLAEWHNLVERVDAIETNLPPEDHDAFFELIGYPVKAAAAMNEKYLAGSPAAADEIRRLTDVYNNQIAGGKWRYMMSDNPRGQLDLRLPDLPATQGDAAVATSRILAATNFPGADFAEDNHIVVMEAEHASAFVPGRDARWQMIIGVGYNGEAVTVFPATVPARVTPDAILAESPSLQFKVGFQDSGQWNFVVRALPTFSVETGEPQRYAIALDDEAPQIISLPVSMSEGSHAWQENVLRDAALTTSRHPVSSPGLHTLKIWMVDPGIVIDTIAAVIGDEKQLGYVWPKETAVANASP
jgi:hypothetical protein